MATDATENIPFIADVNLTSAQWREKSRQEHVRTEDAHTYRRAWKDYLQRVPPASFRQTRNFMMAVIAEGRNFDRVDTVADAISKGPPVLCPMTVGDIDKLISGERREQQTQELSEDASTKNLVRTMRAAINAASRVMGTQKSQSESSVRDAASRHELKMTDFSSDAKHDDPVAAETKSSVETYQYEVLVPYEKWKKTLMAADKTPNKQQWQVLNLVHQRCLYEQREEVSHSINKAPAEGHQEPLFRLIHGLPGSGKSQLLKWIQTYFEEVCHWKNGVQFQFLAPLNGMAVSISGQTVHSWGGISFQNREGISVGSGVVRKGKDNVEQMHVKCAELHFLFVDECGSGAGNDLWCTNTSQLQTPYK